MPQRLFLMPLIVDGLIACALKQSPARLTSCATAVQLIPRSFRRASRAKCSAATSKSASGIIRSAQATSMGRHTFSISRLFYMMTTLRMVRRRQERIQQRTAISGRSLAGRVRVSTFIGGPDVVATFGVRAALYGEYRCLFSLARCHAVDHQSNPGAPGEVGVTGSGLREPDLCPASPGRDLLYVWHAIRLSSPTFALQGHFWPWRQKISFAFNVGIAETGENRPGEDLASFLRYRSLACCC